ncbi:MAG: chemotaxis protein CheW [Phycisphaerales bacterium]
MKEARKFLTFCLGAEHYGIDILHVREIIGLIAITPLPRAPEFVRGVINLRGRIIPAIDLRRRFGLPGVEATKESCMIVVDSRDSDGESSLTALVVDSVREVQDIANNDIEAPPTFGPAVPLQYIQGVGKARDRVILILDTSVVLDMRLKNNATQSIEMRRAA